MALNKILKEIKMIESCNEYYQTITVDGCEILTQDDGTILCELDYTIFNNTNYDESWETAFIELPRLLTNDELVAIPLSDVKQDNLMVDSRRVKEYIGLLSVWSSEKFVTERR